MSSVIDALYQIKYNPFKYGDHVISFYSSLSGVENNLLLAPLIIPLCSHPVYGNSLSSAVFGEKRKSSIWTIFGERGTLYDLQERIDEFRSLTEQCIQYCLINDWLLLDENGLNLSSLDNKNENFEVKKNAFNLGRLLSDLSVVETYAFLGVKLR